MTLKVAMVQQKAVSNDINANLQLAIKYIHKAKLLNADIVLFPEMWSNGYAPPFAQAFDNPMCPEFEKERTDWLNSAIDTNSEYVITLKNLARELHIGICITYLSKTTERPQNTAIIINRSGKIILDYAKVHTCDFSLEYLLQGGSQFNVCEFDEVKIGVMICYDREFPESARVLMLNGAEIILVPNACNMNPARINQLSTRAFENMVGIAMANYPDIDWGGSCAYSPIVFDENGGYLDNCIVKLDDIVHEIVIAEFDIDKIREYRKTETWGNAYRKPKTYKSIISEEIQEPFIRKI